MAGNTGTSKLSQRRFWSKKRFPAPLADVRRFAKVHTPDEFDQEQFMAGIHVEWDTLSKQFSEVAETLGQSIVAVHGGHRVTASGMVWRAGVIVTASHLLRRGEGIELTFAQRDGVKASLAGRDPGTDLAVLQFEEASLAPAVQTAKTSDLRVGQLVLAVGRSKLGDLAAAAGIVARLGGAWQTWRGGRIDSLLRPDLTLYPGQSGSGLVDSRGFVLGMNTSTLARASTITIPTATVDRVLDEILQHGGVFRPYLGLAMQAVALPPEIGGKTGRGLMVMQVEPESPAAASGISLGDIILGVEGDHIGGVEDLQRVLGAKKRGDSVELKYARAGKPATANVKLADRPRR